MSSTSGITCGCSPNDDLVRDAAKDVLAALLTPVGKNAPDELQKAQKELVQRICRSCWDEREVIWVQTYVEPDARLESLLRGTDGQDITADLFLHRAAGIAVDDDVATNFYNDRLLPELKKVPKEKYGAVWLSNRLAHPECPPVVRFAKRGTHVWCSWPALTVDDLYLCVFEGDREKGVYLHVGYPGRATALNKIIGPAGIYLFLRRPQTVPPCLISHLQAFLQCLVTAQLWAMSQRLWDNLKRASEPFALHERHLRTFLDAAIKIRQYVDPLHLDTSALDDLHLDAKAIFEFRNLDRFHDYNQVRNLNSADHLELSQLLEEFLRKLKGRSSALAALVRDKFEATDLTGRWLLARTCYKLTVSLSLLTQKEDDIRLALVPFSTYVSPTATDEEKKQQRLVTQQYAAIAAMQLVNWKANGFTFAYVDKGLCISPDWMSNGASEHDLEELLFQAKANVERDRDRADCGGGDAREWARVLRGLAGTNWEQFKNQVYPEGRAIRISLGLADFSL